MAVATGKQVASNAGSVTTSWLAMATGDTGSPVLSAVFGDKSVQVTGTFGGATINIQGSNDGGATWANLADPQGTAIAISAAGIEQVLEYTEQIRPIVVGGAGVSVNVYLTARKPA